MNLTKIFRIAVVSFIAAMGFASPSHAAVSAFFSAGANCTGAASASFSTGGPPVQVSLCMTTTAPTATCGHTIVLQSAVGEGGRFVVSSPLTLGANYSDPNSEVSQLPMAITNPPIVADFGGTGSVPVAATANQLLATFNLTPQSSATNASYVISLNNVSIAAVDADTTCGATTVPSEAPLTASFTLNRSNAPLFTSASAATFSTTSSNSFTVAATGTPAPTLSLTSGTLPTGVTFTAASGLLQGTPSTIGTSNLVFTASNGTSATQNFTLTAAGQASQTITFVNPGSQSFSSTPIALTATASSGLPVTFTSTTLSVCSVSGSNVTMLTLGTCTIAANQAGNATYLAAAQVAQSFGVVGGVPGAPFIGTGTSGNAQATIAFTPPSSTGGSAISSYTVSCSGISASGTASPISVTNLTNGSSYTCSVTATNSFGTGAASGTVTVMPSNAIALAAIGVQSRKTHGIAGTFDVAINPAILIGGAVSVEPRTALGGPAAHAIVFQFNGQITAAGTPAAVNASMNPVGTVTTAFAGNEVTVTISGVADNTRITVSLTNVNGAGVNAAASMGFLVGDVNSTRSVTSADILQVKGRSGLTTDASNFQYDVNASGAITSADILQVKGRSGQVIP